MSELVPSPAYAIFRDVWNGQTRWQAYYLRYAVHIEDANGSMRVESMVPVCPPVYVRGDAFLDAVDDWRLRGNLTRPWIDPHDRLFDWPGLRRNL